MNDQTPFANALPSGSRVGGVTLEQPIGQGAWGIVYEGRHDSWGRVAVKEYFPTGYAARQSSGGLRSSAPQWQDAVRRGLERFAQEGRALRSIRNDNVVAVHDYVEDGGFLVMEYVDGTTLADALARGRFRDPDEVIALGAALAETLVAIHAKNVLHRDIAPDNIMIRPDGSPVLIDFGGAAAAIATATRSTQNIVKDGYSPLEQYDTSDSPVMKLGPWSDIYATAAVLFRVIAQREPAIAQARLLASGMKTAPDPQPLLTSLAPAGYPPQWLSVIDRGLALLPQDRPQSATAWRHDLEAALQAPAPKRSPLPWIIGALLAVAFLVAAALTRDRWMPAPAPPVPRVSSAPAAVPVHHVTKPRPNAQPKRKPVTHSATPALRPVVTAPRIAAPTHLEPGPLRTPPRPQFVDPTAEPRLSTPPPTARPETDFGPGTPPPPDTDFGPGSH